LTLALEVWHDGVVADDLVDPVDQVGEPAGLESEGLRKVGI
jgi:hypothetical protein